MCNSFYLFQNSSFDLSNTECSSDKKIMQINDEIFKIKTNKLNEKVKFQKIGSFKDKYIKYKKKYILLKQKLQHNE